MSKRSYKKYIGIPFKGGGRDFSGVDCYGIAVLIYKEELGINLWDTSDYSINEYSKDNLMLSNYYKDWKQIDKTAIQELDLLLFCMDTDLPDIATHVAVYLGDNRILHCMSEHSTYTCKFEGTPIERYFHSAYRYKEKVS